MRTPSTSSRHLALRSPFARFAPAALLLALVGQACSSRNANTSGDSTGSSDIALSIGPGTLSLNVGESVTVETTVSTTSSARLYTLKYQSSNAQVANVSATGQITGVSAGTAQVTVTATLLDTGGSASAVVTVNVAGGAVDAGSDAASPAPALSLSPSSMNFGNVTVGATGPVQTLTLTNSGTGNMVLSTCALAGDFSWGPATSTMCVMGNSYAPGASCTMAISGAPKSAGPLTGTLTLTDSAANSPQIVQLTETGVTTSAQKPFLGLSFQGLSLDIGARTYSGGGWTDIVGTDLVYGDTSPRYPAALWGGTAPDIDSLQMIWNSPSDITRQIVTDNSVPPGVSNQVLESTFVNPYVNPTQDNFQTFPDISQPQGMVYFSKWMWLQPDLASRGPFWFELTETKTNGASVGGGDLNTERFDVGIDMASWTNNQPLFYVQHDTWDYGAYTVYAQGLLSPSSSYGSMVSGQTNYAPVPMGQWFRLESAWNRSMNGTGWIWMALTVPGSSDPNLQKGVQVFAQSGALNFSWSGVTQTLGWNKSTIDPINRVFPFGAYSDLVRSSTSTYSLKQTNIEIWPTWPATATAHPANFN